MAEPHARNRLYAPAVDTFNLPSNDIYNSGSGWLVSLLGPDEGFVGSHDWQDWNQEVSSSELLAHWESPWGPYISSNPNEPGDSLVVSDDEVIDQLSGTQSRWLELFYGTYINSLARMAKSEAVARLLQICHVPSLSDHVIHARFQNLIEEAQEPGETMPTDEVIQESKRIVTRLRSGLPTETDIYPENDGKVAIELFGEPGHAFLLVCEPGGNALCVVTVDGISRRARYEDSSRLPDGFVREGLRDVRPDVYHYYSWPTFGW